VGSNTEKRRLDVDEVDGVLVVRLLDPTLSSVAIIMDVNQQLSRLVEDREIGRLLLDLEEVEMVSSVMLGKLTGLQNRLSSSGGKLVLCNLHPRVQEVFAITKLTRVFEIRNDQMEGLAAF
jgi:anti-sigma B factor antagonist